MYNENQARMTTAGTMLRSNMNIQASDSNGENCMTTGVFNVGGTASSKDNPFSNSNEFLSSQAPNY